MGYLQLTKGIPDFTKIVISFWFRVPQASLDKAEAADTGEDESAPFQGIIPLLVMGKRGTGDIQTSFPESETLYYNTIGYSVTGLGNTYQEEQIGDHRTRGTFVYNPGGTITPVPGTIMGTIRTLSVDGAAKPTDPVFVGIDGGGLFVNFETNKKAEVTNYGHLKSSVTPGFINGHGPSLYSGPIPYQGGPHDAYPIGTVVQEWNWLFFPWLAWPYGAYELIEDSSGWQPWPVGETIVQKATFGYTDLSDTAISATGTIQSDLIAVTADQWHHVLISVDLKTIKTHGVSGAGWSEGLAQYVDSAAKLYVALDDQNFTEYNLSSNWTEGDPNEVLTEGGRDVAGATPDTDAEGNEFGIPTYTLSDPKIPSGGAALGLPATAEFVANIYRVEMAELQIFTDVTLDTGDVKNRRAFIDRDGVPVLPLPKVDEQGNITAPPAAQLMGKHPEIVLHGAANWSQGYNTGTMGLTVDEEGNPIVIPNGQFGPTGEIITWAPDPTLYGPQNPAPPPAIRLARKTVAVE